MTVVSVLAAPRCDLGEGPIWDPTTQTLSWVDLHAGVLHRMHRRPPYDCASYRFGAPLSAALPVSEGMLLIRRERVDLVTDLADPSTVRPVATIPLGAAQRCNDAKLDRWGRLWVGTMAPDHPGAAALYFIEPGATSPTLACGGLTLANGIGWSVHDERIYLVDSGSRTVFSACLDSNGLPSDEFAPLLDLRDARGVPDGLCVDMAGGIWLAVFGGAELRCHDPAGPLRELIDLPVRYPTSVAFAGPDLDELVVTTARATPTATDDADAAGHLLTVWRGPVA